MSLSLQAERFDGLVHSFMERLAEAERVLKCGLISEEEQSLLAFSKQHKVSMDDTLSLAIGKDFFFTLSASFWGGQRSGSSTPQQTVTDKSSILDSLVGWIFELML